MTPLDPLRRFAPPRAPVALRERVLAGARVAMTSSVVASRTDRIWFATGWRLAWAGTIAACVLVEAAFVYAARPRAHLRTEGAAPREVAAAAAEIGVSGSGLIGDRVVTNDETANDAMGVRV